MQTMPLPAGTAAAGDFPLRVAAIDIGTNALRFLAVEFDAPASYRVIEEIRVPVRFGHGVFSTGRISEDAAAAAIEGLARMSARMKELAVQRHRAVATCAVRESRNRRDFLRRVRLATGLGLEIISGAEEARLVHAAIRSRLALGKEPWMFAELGGGSVEVYLGDATGVSWCETHAMGAVRLLELFSRAGEEPREFEKLLIEYSETLRLPERVLKSTYAGFAATGGNMEALAKIAGALPDARGVSRFERADLAALIGKLAALCVRDRAQVFNLKPDRADVILPAAIVYERLAALAGAEQIVVPNVGIREGIVLDLAVSAPVGGRVIEERIRHDTMTLGRKFGFEEPHALSVSALALSLFDQLPGLHGLGGRERRLLQAASMLHDIGNFLSYKGHHKHSLYLVSQSELPGFAPREMFVVGNIARYHRKGAPTVRHKGFALLPPADRERVRKLAALLRVADALDREHRGKIARIEVREAVQGVEIRADARGDLLLESWALKKKSRFFQDVFGKRLTLRTGGET